MNQLTEIVPHVNQQAANTAAPFKTVQKRNGALAPWDDGRILRAISLAIFAAKHPGKENVHRLDATVDFGLTSADIARARQIAQTVIERLAEQHGVSTIPSVEGIQNMIEIVVLDEGLLDVARAFILYRQGQNQKRPVVHVANGLQEYIGTSRYCRYSPILNRREVWEEASDRVRDMHIRRFSPKFGEASDEKVAATVKALLDSGTISAEAVADAGGFASLSEEIHRAFHLVSEKKVLPSMRSLQFGGPAIEQANARMFNCSFSTVDRVEFFREYFYLLLCGCGVGFSVQKPHIAKLPTLAPRSAEIELEVEHFVVPDTIEGWSDALHKLLDSYFRGYKVEFSYHLIRRRGSVLKTSGGRAPGHIPLKRALDKAELILAKAAGRSLRPIEVYDILMHTAKAVLSGGIRRSATICLFSADDDEMMNAKTGNWFEENEQRSASNNSAVLIRNEVTRAQFDRLFAAQKAFGEPGFYFADSPDVGSNPCVEIGLNPYLVVTPREIEKLQRYGYDAHLETGDKLTGFQMCNLSTLAGGAVKTPEDFFRFAHAAAVIGTLQADYTDIPYLGPVTRVLNEREALIGVSICGVLDNPEILLNSEVLRRGAAVVKATNAVIATLIGINRAARTTCVKPEGTSSLVLNSGSGIHPHHARRYLRHVQASTADAVFKHFQASNPHMAEPSVYDPNGATAVIAFPVEGPANGIYVDDIDALRFLSIVKQVQDAWVVTGRAYSTYSDIQHNVSNTVNVAPEEWDAVAEFIFENRYSFTGISLLPKSGDNIYQQAPRMAVKTDDDIRKWNSLTYRPVDYRAMPDEQDVTAGSKHRGAAVACSGGACELV